MKRKKCPCCGYYTMVSNDEVIVDICDVCFWQYDLIAHENPEKSIGPNKVSLNEAKQNYKVFGVSEKRFIGRNLTREPYEYEYPSNNS